MDIRPLDIIFMILFMCILYKLNRMKEGFAGDNKNPKFDSIEVGKATFKNTATFNQGLVSKNSITIRNDDATWSPALKLYGSKKEGPNIQFFKRAAPKRYALHWGDSIAEVGTFKIHGELYASKYNGKKLDDIAKSSNQSNQSRASVDMEALQNLSKMYDNGELKVTNITVTNNANIQNSATIDGDLYSNRNINARNINTDNLNSKHYVHADSMRSTKGIEIGTNSDDNKEFRRIIPGGNDKDRWVDIKGITNSGGFNIYGPLNSNHSLNTPGPITGKGVRARDAFYIGVPSPGHPEIKIRRHGGDSMNVDMTGNWWMPGTTVFAKDLYTKTKTYKW